MGKEKKKPITSEGPTTGGNSEALVSEMWARPKNLLLSRHKEKAIYLLE